MPSEQIEAGAVADVEIESDADHSLDPDYVDTLHALYGVVELIDVIHNAHESDIPDHMFASQEYYDELVAAFRTGQKLLSHPDRETISQDMGQLDGDLLAELRATVGYVAPHVGVDLSLPAPADGGESA